MKRFVLCLSVGVLVCALGCPMVWGQATAQISGTVRDQSGAVLPGAEVIATQTDTGVARNTISNETGTYVLPNLAVGPYKLEVSLPGFRTFIQTGIVLQVNSNPVINATLEVGQVSEQVEVQANAALVETRTTTVGNVMENERILELPLNGRNSADLINSVGAAVPITANNASSRSFGGSEGGIAYSVAGGQTFGTAYVLDGAMHNNPYDNLNLPLPFPDALQEFKVETSAQSASQGMHSGASVNSVTKSGTNNFHGDAFEFVRNFIFNARDTFAPKRDSLKRNQFGGTVGGPIKQNKLFFFGGLQRTLVRQDPSDSTSFIPTQAVLAGDWTAMASPACNGGRAIALRSVPGFTFNNNRIDPSVYSKAALNIVSKLATTNDPCGRINVPRINRPNEGQYIGKVDYQKNASHSMFGRYLATTFITPPPFSLTDNILATSVGGRDNLAQSYTLGDTTLFGPNMVNAFRLAVNRTAIHRTSKDFFSAPEIGVKNMFSYMPHYMLLTVTNFFALGGGTESEATFRTTTYQLGDDVSLIKGTHQIAFGGNFAHWRSNSYANVRSPGTFTFDGSATGLGLADFLTGRLTQMIEAAPNTLFMTQWYTGLYAQDTWKATPRVTLNYGLRWEPFLPQTITNGAIFQFDMQRFINKTRSTVFTNAPVGLYYAGDPGFPGKSGIFKIWDTFAPRAGISWDPKGDGKTVVRAGYGLSYDFVNGQFFINSTVAPPFGTDVRVNSPVSGFDDPWRDYPGGNPFPFVFDRNAKFPANGVYVTIPYHMNPNTVHNWNLTVQRQLSSDWLVSASYLGSEASHLWVSRSLNPGQYFFNGTNTCVLPNGVTITGANGQCSTNANIEQRRPLVIQNPVDGAAYGAMDVFDDGGTQSYAGGLFSLQKRLSRNVTMNTNYTFSHCIGDNTQGGSTPNINTGITNPNNRRFDRGNCDQDRRQVFNFSGVAGLPKFGNPTVDKIASGWKFSGIFARRSGKYLNITSGTDVALTGVTNQRPNQLLADPYASNLMTPTGSNGFLSYINRAAFAPAAPGGLGNMGRNTIKGPAFWNLDMAVSREFRVRESQRVELRAEAFNVTNSFRPGDPAVALNSPVFGVISSTAVNPPAGSGATTLGPNPGGGPRIMQFALKYFF